MNLGKNPFPTIYRKYKVSIWILFIAGLVIFPFVYTDDYYKSIAVKILFYIVIAGSLNLINGYSGQFNLGHAGFMCIGAYTAAILATRYGISFWIALPCAGTISAVVGFFVSLPTLRLKGIYLAIVTLGFSEIVRLVALNWTDFTGGPMGVKGIPAPRLFGIVLNKTDHYYFISLGLVFLTLFSFHRILKSRIGRAWIAIREDQAAASSLGIELNKYKSLNFVTSAFFAGVGGCVIAYFYRYVSSDMFTLDEGFNVLSMVIIGGMGTLVGPVIGSIIINSLTEVLRFAEIYRMIFYAGLIIVMMWWRPQGIAGASKSILAGGKEIEDEESKTEETENP
jgi:branched-chain amino acid transport system permease protein